MAKSHLFLSVRGPQNYSHEGCSDQRREHVLFHWKSSWQSIPALFSTLCSLSTANSFLCVSISFSISLGQWHFYSPCVMPSSSYIRLSLTSPLFYSFHLSGLLLPSGHPHPCGYPSLLGICQSGDASFNFTTKATLLCQEAPFALLGP